MGCSMQHHDGRFVPVWVSGLPGFEVIDGWLMVRVSSFDFFSGQNFPIHPLDLTGLSRPIAFRGQRYTACLGLMTGFEEGWGGDDLEMSLGDIFLRNVYSVYVSSIPLQPLNLRLTIFLILSYDFGDDGGEPYMQLLSQLDLAKAVDQVAVIRRRTMAALPQEIPPIELISLLTGLTPVTRSGSSGSSQTRGISLPTGIQNGGDGDGDGGDDTQPNVPGGAVSALAKGASGSIALAISIAVGSIPLVYL